MVNRGGTVDFVLIVCDFTFRAIWTFFNCCAFESNEVGILFALFGRGCKELSAHESSTSTREDAFRASFKNARRAVLAHGKIQHANSFERRGSRSHVRGHEKARDQSDDDVDDADEGVGDAGYL